MCSNEITYENECRKFISMLSIPDGYELEVSVIYEARSMTSGYNRGMYLSDAKYKIYIHHDVYLINRNLLYDLLSIFSDDSIGMVGQVGVKEMPMSGVMWGEKGKDKRIGKWIQNGINKTKLFEGQKYSYPYDEVVAVDGLFIATQYDIPWREDIFTGFDFYDVSQAFEFRKAGYKVVIPSDNMPWCIHDSKTMSLINYYEYRDVFMKEYYGITTKCTEDNYSTNCIRADLYVSKINDMLKSHTKKDYDVLCMLFNQQDFLDNTVRYSTKLMYAYVMMVIISKASIGAEDAYVMNCYSIDEFIEKWRRLKFLIFEIEFLELNDSLIRLKELVKAYNLSDILINELINTVALNKERVREILKVEA